MNEQVLNQGRPSSVKREFTSRDIFSADVTASGSFDLKGIPGGQLARLMNALPCAAMVVYRSGHIVFANRACSKLASDHRSLEGTLFASIFADSHSTRKAGSMIEDVCSSRKTQVRELLIKTEAAPVRVRMHVRSMRLEGDRSLLAVLEDLSSDRGDLACSEAASALERAPAEVVRHDAVSDSTLRTAPGRNGQAIFQSIVGAFDGLIFVCSESYEIQYANEKLVQRTGSNPVGRKCYEVVHGLTEICPGCQHAEVLSGQTSQRQTLSPVDNNWYNVFGTSIGNPDGSLSKLVIMYEITDLKQANEELLQTERLKAVRELATTVAHRFNNLLQLIIGGARVALQNLHSSPPDIVAERLQHIIATSKSGAETINRLERLAGLGINETPDENTVLDLSDMVRQAIEMTKPWWKAKPERSGSKLRLRLKLKKGCLVRGRSNELFEAVVNLIKNAAEELPHGGTIQISTTAQGDKVILGISNANVPTEADKHEVPSPPVTPNRRVNAKGIELVVSYGIVTRHGGTISAEASNGCGTNFTVSLPLSKETPSTKRSTPAQPIDLRLRILLVDDFQPLVAMLRDGLAACDHEVFTALSGTEALVILEQQPVDLVVCDLGMPDMNGWQVAREVQALCSKTQRAKIPFILLTGWAGQLNVTDRIAECGVDRVLAKPVDIPQLLEAISEVVSDSVSTFIPPIKDSQTLVKENR